MTDRPLRPPPGPEHPGNPVWRWVAAAVGIVLVAIAVVGALGSGKDKPDRTAAATNPPAATAPATDATTAPAVTAPPPPKTAPATTTTTTTTTAAPARPPADPRVRTLKRVARDAREFCASTPLAKVKATYGGTESFSAAHAYAQQAWQEWLRITAEGACIKGMQDRNFK